MNSAIDILMLFSWAFMLAGPVSGAYMATWAYDGEKSTDFFGGYTSEPRRIYRIAHINCFVFPYMGIMWALAIERTLLSSLMVGLGAALMITSTLFMTIPLFASLKWKRLKGLTLIGLLSLLGGISIIAYGYACNLLSQ